MFNIKGAVTTAKCFTKVIEQEACDQIRRMCDHEFTAGSQVRIMPDVHAGKGCTVGTTMTIHDKVVPNIVGVDIGCGMYTVALDARLPDLQRINAACHEIPSGFQVWPRRIAQFDFEQLQMHDALLDTNRLTRSLGTLGGGNHFIEVNVSQNGIYYLVVHSGSRNLGKQVAEHYQHLAIALHHGKGDDAANGVSPHKAKDRDKEQKRSIHRRSLNKRDSSLPKDLCYLSGVCLEDYLHDMHVCQQYAQRNREHIAEYILKQSGLTPTGAFHTIHNYIDCDAKILRKGAISANKGEQLLIPLNMRDGSILGIGKGNPDWNYSAPHGAGRLMSRTEAKAVLSMADYRSETAEIYSTTIHESTLDEAPMAYKAMEDIVDVIGDTVEVLEVLKPVYNFKASNLKK